MTEIHIIDSHTGGEPTRVVVAGGPDLGNGPLAERLDLFRRDFDRYRKAIVCEPRGSDVLVGALLCEPVDSSAIAGVIFFNNVGYLGMCGHGTIGLIETLHHLGRIGPGTHRIETPVGTVSVALHDDGRVSIDNVASYRTATKVRVDVPEVGPIVGDVAWGGNWFFLVGDHGERLHADNVDRLTDVSWRIRRALNASGYPEVDHVELFAPTPLGDSQNFVLCPGKAYDRSPCGTGTSAKLACLAADGKLKPGQTWRQVSIIGTAFDGSYRWEGEPGGRIVPTITGTAHVNAIARLILDDRDPACWGL